MDRSLETLIRLHRLELDQKRRQQAALREQAETIGRRIGEIQDEVASELSGDVHPTFDVVAYVSRKRGERRQLESTRSEIERQAAEVTDEIADAFRELKKFEQIRDRREAEAKAAADKQEAAAMDEIAVQRFGRKADSSGPG